MLTKVQLNLVTQVHISMNLYGLLCKGIVP